MAKLNWKQLSSGRYRARASRAVGGVYSIKYREHFYGSLHTGKGFWVRCYAVDYQTGGGGLGNVSQCEHRTLQDAKAVAQFHHDQRRELIHRYSNQANIPSEAWYRFQEEKLAFEQQLSADMHAEIQAKWKRLDEGWEGEPGQINYCPL
jgi:hypothetical protein